MSACATDPDSIQSLVADHSPDHLALTCDVTHTVEVGALATRMLERFGPFLPLSEPRFSPLGRA